MPPRPATEMRILLVEPDANTRTGLQTLLTAAGYDVAVAEGIDAASPQVFFSRVDLLLLDADVAPGRSGARVLDLLVRMLCMNAGASAVLLTSCPDDVSHDVEHLGAVAVLEKPVKMGRLRREIEEAARRLEPSTREVPQNGRRCL
ncbi:MAG: response regulator [Candidatus Rokubacteria bacterium]|nr:response regulator [Candidatus Rokubacteria bacterium]